MVINPRSCIMELWTRNQKSASCAVSGTCAECCHALYPGIAAGVVTMVTNAVIVGFHCDVCVSNGLTGLVQGSREETSNKKGPLHCAVKNWAAG